MSQRRTSTYGFARTSKLLEGRIRKASESRGFAQARLLTHWEEVAGADIAAISRPVEVSYARQGMGATLTVLTNGSNAPLVEMQKEQLRARINAVYGYNAIARVRVTQTSATGFADGQVDFTHRRDQTAKPEPSAGAKAQAQKIAHDIGNEDLRSALERLAANVLSKTEKTGGTSAK